MELTPKEKAKELYDKYFLLHESSTDENGVWIVSALNKGLAKKCALIAVDEILNAIPNEYLDIHGGETYMQINEDVEYWNEVKQEINNL
jgi:hypothetical protein